MSEEQRQRLIRQTLCHMGDRPVTSLSTGVPALDTALGIGGFPRGRLVEIFGAEASGKTTLAFHAIAATQQGGGTAALLDAEHAFNARHAAACGVSLDALVFAQPEWGEQALAMVRQFAASGVVDLIVVDSAAALIPKVEIEMGVGTSPAGLHAAVLGRSLRAIATAAERSGACVVFLNQLRSRSWPADAPERTVAGGALQPRVAVRIELRVAGQTRVHSQVVKNNVTGAVAEADFDLRDPSAPAEPSPADCR